MILHGDSLHELKTIADESIDTIITDPPYNLSDKGMQTNHSGKRTNPDKGHWDKFSHDDFYAFNKQWLEECWRVLRPTGSMIIFGTIHSTPYVTFIAHENGWYMPNMIVWFKPNAVPQLYPNRLCSSNEQIVHIAKNKKQYYFDYAQAKNINEGKQMRDVWTLPTVRRTTTHPTQKPLGLMERLVRLYSKPGDIVLDPFAGSGSTNVAAKRLGRETIGIEREAEYVEIARARLAHVKPEIVQLPPEEAKPAEPPVTLEALDKLDQASLF
jgi:DNA modification methylase